MILGIDVSTRKLAFAGIRDNGDITSSVVTLPAALRGARRFTCARDLALDAFGDLEDIEDVSAVAVEIPWARSGGGGAFSLLGIAAVCLETAQRFWPDAVVMEFGAAEWKKASVGWGNADKSQVMVHARARGLEVADQDLADALCIAEAMVGRWATRTAA